MILNTFVTTTRLLNDILNNEKIQNIMMDLYERYLDEGNYECVRHYNLPIEEALLEIINNGHTKGKVKAVAIVTTKEPFGFKYESYYVDMTNGTLKVGTIEVQFMVKNGNEISYELKNFNKY